MRLIDADALKDTICSNMYPVTDYFNSRDYGMFWTGGIEKAIDEQPTIESAQPEQRWIPCSDRLPKAENYMPKRVIVTTSWKKVYVANYCVDHWEICDIDYKLSSVVAWMPLPKPYKEEN